MTPDAMGGVRVAINGWFLHQPTTGSGQYTSRLLAALQAAAPVWEFIPLAPDSNAPAARLGENLYKPWFEQIGFLRMAREQDAHLLHVPYWGSPIRSSAPVVVTVHDIIPLILPQYRGDLRVRVYTQLAASAARRAAVVLTDSQASRRDIVERLRISPSQVSVAYLAAGEEYRPQPQGVVDSLRKRIGLPSRYVLYFGGFDVRKNLRVVMDAFARLAAQEPEASLVVAGRLPERDTAFSPDPRRLAAEADVRERVEFTGRIEEADKPALYSGAEAFLFPSRYEGFGLPPLEAMACGAPVIASNAASLPEIVGDGGLLHDPDDADAMGESLVSIWQEPGLRRALSERALAQASRFSWARTADQTLRAYRQALSDN